jgi:hypothetical protein
MKPILMVGEVLHRTKRIIGFAAAWDRDRSVCSPATTAW